jgi:hypothetical protein
MRKITLLYLRCTSSGPAFLAFLSSLLVCTGCVHRISMTDQIYTLEKTSGYSLLVPSLSTQSGDQDFQTSTLTLPGSTRTADRPIHPCVIQGPVFSLTPANKPNQWTIKSLSTQGWQKRAGNLDMHAEWNHFLRDLLEAERQSCFPRKENFYSMRRRIAEAVPLPANEVAFFTYSFGGSGFVDLAPGMQIKIERPLIQNETSTTRANYKGSLEADYRVTAPSSIGVELLLSRTVNRRAGRSLATDANLVFDLSGRFKSKPLLRLFLQSIGDGKAQPTAILLGASDFHDLDEGTLHIEERGRTSCPATPPSDLECISFGTGTAVSLLSSVRINGKAELRPFGTSVGYLLDVAVSGTGRRDAAAQTQVLQTASVHRSLLEGGYAEVDFPKTIDSVNQIVLLPGDRVAWKQESFEGSVKSTASESALSEAERVPQPSPKKSGLQPQR